MKKIALYAGLTLSIIFLWLALRHASWNEIVAAFERARWWCLIPMLVCHFVFYFLKAIRWRQLLSQTIEISSASLVPAMMVGAAGNNLLPAHSGELIRVYLAGEKFGVAKSTVLGTVMVERVFDLIAVTLIFFVGVFSGNYSGIVLKTAAFLLVLAVILIFFLALLLVSGDSIVLFLRRRLTFTGEMIREKIINQFELLSAGLQALRSPRLLAKVLALSIVMWALMAVCIYSAMLAFDIDALPQVAMVILGILVAGLSLPTSPGFFGTIEYCFVLGLTAVGVDSSVAVSAAIFYHLPAWALITLTGLFFFRFNKVSISEVRNAR